jgi:hypothetical protein
MDTGQLIGGIVILAILIYLIGGFALGITIISAREMAIWLRLKRSGKVGDAAIERLCVKANRSQDRFVIFRSPEDDDTLITQLIIGRTFKRLKERTESLHARPQIEIPSLFPG